ncbi:NAD(P)-binding protein [Viridothelium virens]|uniref:NAD(P)-binding protein n=1 Tax=Viridothelium virens TaxID=1048519 RepID=A0A6A6HKZ3_VIRVR|nr:NAD(P)-binding protein [Viridothelium virens]
MSQSRTVLITGCSLNGLGDYLARTFHAKGLRVIATARNLSKMAHLEKLGIETLELDVTSLESCSECVDIVTKLTGGSLDILVNNAGGGYYMPLMDVDIDRAKQIYETNVWGVLRVTQAFIPLLRNSTHSNGAMVVNQTSIVSVINSPFGGSYNSSKAAAAMISDTLRLELKPFGIKVIDLKTGTVASEFWTNQSSNWQLKLPANSMYQPAKDLVEKMINEGPFGMRLMPQDIWAERVVGDLLKPSPSPRIWRGYEATLCWFFSALLPFTWRDGMLMRMHRFDILSKSLQLVKRQ